MSSKLVTQNPNGSWSCRYLNQRGEDTTQVHASALDAELEVLCQAGPATLPRVGELRTAALIAWYGWHQTRRGLRPGAIAKQLAVLRQGLVPLLQTPFGAVTAAQLVERRHVMGSTLSPDAAASTGGCIRAMFHLAQQAGFIPVARGDLGEVFG